MRYRELCICLRRRGKGFAAEIWEAPHGGAAGGLELGWSRYQVASLVRRMERLLKVVSPRELGDEEGQEGRSAYRRAEMCLERLQKHVGRTLYKALFHRDVALRLAQGCAVTNERDEGLRIRIVFGGPGEGLTEVAHLAALPWEALRDPQDDRLLALDERTSVVRAVDSPRDEDLLVVEPPVRVLVAAASPADGDPLDVYRELDQLVAQLKNIDGVEVHSEKAAGFATVASLVVARPFHVFHFMGHGTFDPVKGQGGLVFQGENGQGDVTPAREIAECLRQSHTLRLAVLNACRSAHVPEHPFGGAAAALVRGGLPVVVANQFSISDSAALAFSGAFYRALAAGEPIERCVSQGRRAIHFPLSSPEWMTPVLYMSVRDGRLFAIAPSVVVLGIRFLRIAGAYLSEKPLTEEDYARLLDRPGEAASSLPKTGLSVAEWQSLLARVNQRLSQEGDDRRLRLPSRDELRTAVEMAPGAGEFYQYCATTDAEYPYAGINPLGEIVYIPGAGSFDITTACVLRPALDVR